MNFLLFDIIMANVSGYHIAETRLKLGRNCGPITPLPEKEAIEVGSDVVAEAIISATVLLIFYAIYEWRVHVKMARKDETKTRIETLELAVSRTEAVMNEQKSANLMVRQEIEKLQNTLCRLRESNRILNDESPPG